MMLFGWWRRRRHEPERMPQVEDEQWPSAATLNEHVRSNWTLTEMQHVADAIIPFDDIEWQTRPSHDAGHVRVGVVRTTKTLTEDEANAIKHKWRERYSGPIRPRDVVELERQWLEARRDEGRDDDGA